MRDAGGHSPMRVGVEIGGGNFGVWNVSRNDAFQTVFNDRF